ncbi:MAG: nitroreductase family protein [Dehalococcoidales bacterium]|nr:nitroreductase family protein [Dehalococcoidales bacterium]
MDIYETVIKRRSIREFKDIPVPYDTLERCVNAARLAPTAGNRQLCEYIIVDDEQLLPQVLNAVDSWFGMPRPREGWSPGRRPKAYIVTLINTELEAARGISRTDTNYDVGMAVENMALIDLEQGLGSCVLTGIAQDKLRQVLNIPDKYEIAIMLALGFSDESPVLEIATNSVERWVDSKGVRHIPKRKLEDIMHRNKFPQRQG